VDGARALTIEIRILGPDEAHVLDSVAAGVFDGPIDRSRCAEFLSDPRHHLAVALDRGSVVGMASAVHYVHPDKPAELWINEVATAPAHRRMGLARALLSELTEHARSLGCSGVWVLTDRENEAAMRLYRSIGGKESAEEVVMFSWSLTEP
jgi:ribosomal protein S18 acetylase RimI-like enzyme